MSSYNNFKKQLMRNTKVKEEYNRLRPEYEVLDKIIELRIKHNITQKQLAQKLHTKQSAISRLEKGLINPTVHFLAKYADIFGKKLIVEFK